MSQSTHSIYNFTDYKLAIKDRVKFLRAKRPAFTMKELAARASMQHTYLSRCLNDDRSQIGEDQLFLLAQNLELLPEEIDFVMLLRSYDSSQDPRRKEMLFKKIDTLRKRHLASTEHQEWNTDHFQDEMSYLFNPICVLIHVALFIKDYQKNPRALLPSLGITSDQLKEILTILHKSDYIELSSEDPFQVLEVKKKYPHFGREHPLTRAHQASLKSVIQSRVNQTSEVHKESLLFTFTMDESGFEKVKDEIKELVKKVQAITFDCKQKNVYQLSLDFLRWL